MNIELPDLPHVAYRYDADRRVLWYWMRNATCFTLDLLRDLRRFQESVADRFTGQRADESPIDYLVGGSQTAGVFSYGGHLQYFADMIRARNRAALSAYARACIDVVYATAHNLHLPLTTIALVQGDALGGGFEAALSNSVVIAEERSTLAFPESLFDLLPGMGAYSLLVRRVDVATTERLITSGQRYSARQLHELGVIDLVVADGRGEHEVDQYIARHQHRRRANRLLQNMRDRVRPLVYEELKDIAEMWVGSALGITERELRVMERLSSMQRTKAPEVASTPGADVIVPAMWQSQALAGRIPLKDRN